LLASTRPSSAASLRTRDGCAVVAVGQVSAGPTEIASLRRQPDATGRVQFSPPFLKHSDEQTVVGLAALFRAVDSGNLSIADMSLWGVVAAPRHMGRVATAAILERTFREGALAASPLIIPHRSLHAVSGTITQALGIQGPNFGVGGGPGNLAEGFLVALTLLSDAQLPGLWLVLTEWNPEPVPGGEPSAPVVCHALALALAPASATQPALRLRLAPQRTSVGRLPAGTGIVALGHLLKGATIPSRGFIPVDGALGLEVERGEG
jgi:hypothetical protein